MDSLTNLSFHNTKRTGVNEITDLLLKNGTVLAAQVDSSNYFEQAYSIICTKKDETNHEVKFTQFRSTAFKVLAEYYTTHPYEKKYFHILDRLPYLIESCQINQMDDLLHLIEILSNTYSTDLVNHWNTVLNKTIQTMIKSVQQRNEDLLSKESTLSPNQFATQYRSNEHYKIFVFQMFVILLQSKLRPFFIQHIKTIKELCLQELLYSPFYVNHNASTSKKDEKESPLLSQFPDNQMSPYFSTIIATFNLINSLENVDYWTASLQWIYAQIFHILKEIGLPMKLEMVQVQQQSKEDEQPSKGGATPAAAVAAAAGESKNSEEKNKFSGANFQSIDFTKIFQFQEKGIKKTLMLKNLFEIFCELLNGFYSVGCTSGLITFDITNFIHFVSKLLAFHLNIQVTDATNFIEDEKGLSLVDKNFILSQLKLMILKPFHSLIQQKFPGYQRYGSIFVQPILSLFMKQTEIVLIPALYQRIIAIFIDLIKIYPLLIASYLNDPRYNYLEILQDLFYRQVTLLTERRLAGNREETLSSSNATMANQANKKRKLENKQQKSSSTIALSSNEEENQLIDETDIYYLYSFGKRKFYFNEEIEEENDEFVISFFQLIEQLLLSCSSYLRPTFSYVINQGIYSMLITLEKGIVNPTLYDKRLLPIKNRLTTQQLFERIRFSSNLQESLVSLTIANILTFHYFNIDEDALKDIAKEENNKKYGSNNLQSKNSVFSMETNSKGNKKGKNNTTATSQLLSTSMNNHNNNSHATISATDYLHAHHLHVNCYSLNLYKLKIICEMIMNTNQGIITPRFPGALNSCLLNRSAIESNSTTTSYIRSDCQNRLYNVAMKGLHTVTSLLHPINLPLPALPAKEIKKHFIDETRRRLDAAAAANTSDEVTEMEVTEEQVVIVETSAVVADEEEANTKQEEEEVNEEEPTAKGTGKKRTKEGNLKKKGKKNAKPEVSSEGKKTSKETAKTTAAAPSFSLSTQSTAVPSQAAKKAPQQTDDDDELPDLDIE